jgi:hypothetical protein
MGRGREIDAADAKGFGRGAGRGYDAERRDLRPTEATGVAMRVRRFPAVSALISLAALVACAPGVGGTKGSYRPVDDACGAAGLQMWVGQPLAGLTALPLDQPMRVLKPGQIMSLEYQENRLSVTVDGSGTITRLTCG